MNRLVSDKLPELMNLCQRYSIKSLHLFGSAASGELTSKSDLDFLVSFNDELSIEEYTDNYFL
jgi:predicted nucleotidyltransferase